MATEGNRLRAVTILLATGLPLLAGCGPYPRDIEGTTERVEARQTIHVGLTDLRSEDESRARGFVAALEHATGARAISDKGPAELQLARLDQGALDVVIGDFSEESPWLPEVAVIEPILRRREGDRVIGLSPVAKNGENQWVGLLEKTVRDMGASQ
jgi:hypothetical protein